MKIQKGFPEAERDRVADLFWQAFSGKLARVMRPERKALRFIAGGLQPSHALSALSDAGDLLGVAGFKTTQGGLLAGSFDDLAAVYGWLGAIWRGPLLDLTDRPLRPDELLMDGIFVAPEARGHGVGTALIEAILAEARGRGMSEVRLDVIDSNPRARALYERLGFETAGRENLGLLRPIFGFHHATIMRRPVDTD